MIAENRTGVHPTEKAHVVGGCFPRAAVKKRGLERLPELGVAGYNTRWTSGERHCQKGVADMVLSGIFFVIMALFALKALIGSIRDKGWGRTTYLGLSFIGLAIAAFINFSAAAGAGQ